MKKLLLLLAIVSLSLISCKKQPVTQPTTTVVKPVVTGPTHDYNIELFCQAIPDNVNGISQDSWTITDENGITTTYTAKNIGINNSGCYGYTYNVSLHQGQTWKLVVTHSEDYNLYGRFTINGTEYSSNNYPTGTPTTLILTY